MMLQQHTEPIAWFPERRKQANRTQYTKKITYRTLPKAQLKAPLSPPPKRPELV